MEKPYSWLFYLLTFFTSQYIIEPRKTGEIMDWLFNSEMWIYNASMSIVVALLVAEFLALMVGGSLNHTVDLDADLEASLDWLHLGKIPLIVFLIVLLSSFSFVGYGISFLAKALGFSALSPWISAPIALVTSLPIVSVAGRALAKFMPGFESDAITNNDLLGKIGVITVGECRKDLAAEVRITMEDKRSSYARVVLTDPDAVATKGQELVLVRHVSGNLYEAVVYDATTPLAQVLQLDVSNGNAVKGESKEDFVVR